MSAPLSMATISDSGQWLSDRIADSRRVLITASLHYRQPYAKRASAAGFTLQRDFPAVCDDDLPGDRETDSYPANAPRLRRRAAHKFLEDTFLFAAGDA